MKCPKCQSDNPFNFKFCQKCGTQLPTSDGISVTQTKTLELPLQELKRGSTFAGRYEVIEELGKGGMGKVYRVEDTKISEEVALKLIKPEIAADKEILERFSNELKYARKIIHRNIGRMYHLSEDKGTHYITMEYVAGENLESMIRMSGQLSIATAIHIAKQMCEGVSEAHRLGVVHRDLKPSNIIVDKEGNTRIMDFGLARSLEEKKSTEAGVMIGTPEYMSPEQVEGEKIDLRSDIYSLGIILYEMMAGKLPFEGETPLNIALKHKTETPSDPRTFNTQIPKDLSRLILRCLEKDKKNRYQSAEELLDELGQIERGIPTGEKHVFQERSIAKIRETVKDRWIVFILLPVLIIVCGIAYFYFKREKPPLPSEEIKMLVVLPFENLGPPGDEYFADGLTEEITSRLSTVHGIGVISRTSAFQYKKSNKTIKQIGEELNVEYILEGTIRWDRTPDGKGRVRVTPQLIQASDDTHIWSDRYDRIIQDIFTVQSEIAEQVIKKLDIKILEPERQVLKAKPTSNLEAYDLYLRANEKFGEAYIHQDAKEYEESIELLQKAVELDPEFTAAYLFMARIHGQVFGVGIDRTKERLAKMRGALGKALRLQPDLPEAQLMLGNYYLNAFSDFARAQEIFESVQKARPNLTPTFLGYIQRTQGKWKEAIENLEKAFKFDPRASNRAHGLGRTYAWIWQYEKSEEWFERALSISPDLYYSKLGLARLPLLSKGDTKKARTILETLPQHVLTDYNWYLLGMLERNYQEILDRFSKTPYDVFEEANFYVPINLAYASVYHAMKEFSLMKTHAESARLKLEKAIGERPEDPRLYSPLGLTYAYLGRHDEAIREGIHATNLHPISKDAFNGPQYILNMAKIFTIVGEHGKAIEQLNHFFSIPSGNNYSFSMLRIDPAWDVLHEHPEFQNLLEKKREEVKN